MSTTTYPDHNRFTSRMRASVKACLLRHGMTLQEYNGQSPRAAGNGVRPRLVAVPECERCAQDAVTTVQGWRLCDDCARSMERVME